MFFGSSIQVLSNILDAAGIDASIQEKAEITRINSPLPHHSRVNSIRIPESLSPASVSPSLSRDTGMAKRKDDAAQRKSINYKPRFLVLDLSSVSTIDATSARGCWLQLAKMASARGIVVLAAGQNSRIDWIMQTHDCATRIEPEKGIITEEAKQKIILFDDLNDALQFAEKTLVTEKPSNLAFKRFEDLASPAGVLTSISLSTAFTHFIGVEPEHAKALEDYEKSGRSFHVETKFKAGETIFSAGTNSDGFFIVLSGTVVVLKDGKSEDKDILSGAGRQQSTSRRKIVENSSQVSSVLSVGRIFGESVMYHHKCSFVARLTLLLLQLRCEGFVDFVLQRPRTFSVVAGSENTLIAKVSLILSSVVHARVYLKLPCFLQCHRDGLDSLKAENPAMDR